MVYIQIPDGIYPRSVTNVLMIFHDLPLYHENILYALNGLESTLQGFPYQKFTHSPHLEKLTPHTPPKINSYYLNVTDPLTLIF